MGREEQIQIRMGQDRQLVTAIDLLRASEFVTGYISGANTYVSGVTILSAIASSIIRTRPVSIHLHNRETSHMTVLFRDGAIAGSIVCGPYVLNATQGRDIPLDELLGRRFLSGVYMVCISGTFATGIDYQMAYVNEPDPNAPGGYLE